MAVGRLETLHWGIAVRLALLVFVPVIVTYAVLLVVLVGVWRDEAQSTVIDRGRLIAAALATAAHYSVVSGNVEYLERVLPQLLGADPSVVGIDVLDAKGVMLASTGGTRMAESFTVERAIEADTLDIDYYTGYSAPHLDLPGQPPRGVARAPKGFVRVVVTPGPVWAEKLKRLYIVAALLLLAPVLGLVPAILTARGLASKLSTAEADKRRLIGRSNAAVEEERERIAAAIHDDLNASVIVVKFHAQHIASLAAGPNNAESRSEIGKTAQEITAMAHVLYATARRIVRELRPELLDTLGLEGAVQELVRTFDSMHHTCRFSVSCEALPRMSSDIAITAYRLVQEALSNVVKHAQAGSAAVMIRVDALAERLTISVVDNGIGFDVTVPSKTGVGLLGMRERVSVCGGKLAIESGVGEGTRVLMSLPLQTVGAAP